MLHVFFLLVLELKVPTAPQHFNAPEPMEIQLTPAPNHKNSGHKAKLLGQSHHSGADNRAKPNEIQLPSLEAQQGERDSREETPPASSPPNAPAVDLPENSKAGTFAPKQAPDSLQQTIDKILLDYQAHADMSQAHLQEKVIDSSTREYVYATYMDSWRRKVENEGNRHYPAEARRRNLNGSLILDVALRADGSVYRVEVQRSSGIALLDQAAKKIVYQAAPYSPFPPNIQRKIKILHIIRTWNFSNNLSTDG